MPLCSDFQLSSFCIWSKSANCVSTSLTRLTLPSLMQRTLKAALHPGSCVWRANCWMMWVSCTLIDNGVLSPLLQSTEVRVLLYLGKKVSHINCLQCLITSFLCLTSYLVNGSYVHFKWVRLSLLCQAPSLDHRHVPRLPVRSFPSLHPNTHARVFCGSIWTKKACFL